jgi:predicted amidohydrolase
MSGRVLRVGMAQMLVEGGQPESNLRRAVTMIHDAAARGAAVVVLPECLDLGWTHPCARRLARPIPGPHSDRLADAAIDAGVFVAAGLVERDGGRLYNAAVLISPDGEIVLKHRKINELAIAFDLYETGSSLAVAETQIGRIGLNICADNFSPTLWRSDTLWAGWALSCSCRRRPGLSRKTMTTGRTLTAPCGSPPIRSSPACIRCRSSASATSARWMPACGRG